VQDNTEILVTDDAFHIVSAFAAADFDDEGYRSAIAHSELPLPVHQNRAGQGRPARFGQRAEGIALQEGIEQ